MRNDLPVYVLPLLSGQCAGILIITDYDDAFTCNIWANEQLCCNSIP